MFLHWLRRNIPKCTSHPAACTGQTRCCASSKVPVLIFVPVRDRRPISALGKEREETWGTAWQRTEGVWGEGRPTGGAKASAVIFVKVVPDRQANKLDSGWWGTKAVTFSGIESGVGRKTRVLIPGLRSLESLRWNHEKKLGISSYLTPMLYC